MRYNLSRFNRPMRRSAEGLLATMNSSGAVVAGSLIRNLLSGNYLDVFVIGDSNAGFDGTVTTGGFWESLQDASQWNCREYGTGLFEPGATNGVTVYPTNGATGENNTVQGMADAITTTGGTTWSRGSAVTSLLDSVYYPGNTQKLAFPGTGIYKDFAYLSSTVSSVYHSSWVALNYNASYPNAMNSRVAGVYRMMYAAPGAASSTAQLQTYVYLVSGSVPVTTNTMNFIGNPAVGAITVDNLEASYEADASRGKMYGVFGVTTSDKGPLGLIFRSFYRTGVPGFSTTNWQTMSGGTSQQIGLSFSESDGCRVSTIKTYFQEAVTRQRSAGGAGNIVVFVTMGTNDGTANSAVNYPVAAQTIISQCNAAWNQLGYPQGRLGFILAASCPWTSFDPNPTTQALNASFQSNPQVCIVDINDLASQSYLSANLFYAGGVSTPAAHLSAAGYKAVANRIINKVRTL
jgi:hypothetical protein